jgi:hypothetical protein
MLIRIILKLVTSWTPQSKESILLRIRHYKQELHWDTKDFYFEAENIDFGKLYYLILKTSYLCATREGMGFGKKSIIDHIYRDAQPSFYIENVLNQSIIYFSMTSQIVYFKKK